MPDFTASGLQFLKHSFNLLPHDFGRARFDIPNAFWILRGYTSDGTRPMHAKSGKRF